MGKCDWKSRLWLSGNRWHSRRRRRCYKSIHACFSTDENMADERQQTVAAAAKHWIWQIRRVALIRSNSEHLKKKNSVVYTDDEITEFIEDKFSNSLPFWGYGIRGSENTVDWLTHSCRRRTGRRSEHVHWMRWMLGMSCQWRHFSHVTSLLRS